MEIGIQKVSEFLQSEKLNFLSVRFSGPPIGAGSLIFWYHLSVGHRISIFASILFECPSAYTSLIMGPLFAFLSGDSLLPGGN